MEQTIGLLITGWKLILLMASGTSVLTVIGIGLLARLTGFFDAYAGERAKLLAQFRPLTGSLRKPKS